MSLVIRTILFLKTPVSKSLQRVLRPVVTVQRTVQITIQCVVYRSLYDMFHFEKANYPSVLYWIFIFG